MSETTEGVGVGVALEFLVGLGNKLDRDHAWREKHTDIVTQVPILAQIGGTGSADLGAPQMAPPRGHCWSVRWFSLTGFSAGQVAVNINALEPFIPFIGPPSATNSGFFRFGRGEFLLFSGDRFTVTSTGITGNVLMTGRADLFPDWYLRKYLD